MKTEIVWWRLSLVMTIWLVLSRLIWRIADAFGMPWWETWPLVWVLLAWVYWPLARPFCWRQR